MPRRARVVAGEVVYHVMNRGCGRMTLFSRDGDYDAFEEVLADALRRTGVKLLAYCVMPNHWHLVLRPASGDQLPRMMHWLTMTHTQRWRHYRGLVGLGPLYQGRYKAFAVEEDGHFLTVCRYVERNALRAGLVRRAEEGRWSSLHPRMRGVGSLAGLLAEWPVDGPGEYLTWVNEPQTASEEEAVRRRVRNGRPYGNSGWERDTARRLGMAAEPRRRGRPNATGAALGREK
jgi:putative transposase